MENKTDLFSVAEGCINVGLPFALYAFPNEDEFHFEASLPDADACCVAHLDRPTWNGFAINFFGNDESYTAGVTDMIDLAEARDIAEKIDEKLYHPTVAPAFRSTPVLNYKASLHRVIDTLKKRGGKVVMSQMTAVATERSVAAVVADYFSRFPATFRFLCYTPETGAWLGASPELLIDYDTSTGQLSTMALAGTRSVTAVDPWDKKNLEEHEMVVDFIGNTLASLGMDAEADDLGEMKYGNIVHLFTPIKAEGNVPVGQVLGELSPTPALCGLPRNEAIHDIVMNEFHERLCYGGYVAVKTGTRVRAYANLRSAFLAPGVFDDGRKGYIYNIYSGGGITALSKVDDEWDEAMSKCRPLLCAVTGSDNPSRSEIVTGFSVQS